MLKMCLNNKLFLSAIIVLFSVVYVSADYDTSDWGFTQRKFKTIEYTWTISNYSSYDKFSVDYLKSPIFPADDDDYKWQIHLFLKDLYNSGSENYITLFLMPLFEDKIEVKYKFALLSSDNREIIAKTAYSVAYGNILLGNSPYTTKSIIANSANKLLPNDVLTVFTEIVIPVGVSSISGHCRFQKSNHNNSQNVLSLLENELFSDAKISIGSHQFLVHRAILASASSVFLTLFKEKQNRNEVIKITDVDVHIFRELLRFIYSGKVEGIDKVAEHLLPVAEKYNVTQLKILCEEALCRNLTSDRAIDTLILAQNNGAENLELEASKFIAAHTLQVIHTPGYKAVTELHPLLKVFHAAAEKSITTS